MTDQVRIKITGLQKEIDPEPTVETAVGIYSLRNGHHYIRYELEGVKCLIKITDSSITTSRTVGTQVSKMEFIEGQTTSSTYYAGGYPFDTVIVTHSIRKDIKPDRLTFDIVYDLTMNGSYISRAELKIELLQFND